MRLNRFLARSGVASRRKSEEYITAGRVEVNGQVITDLSYQVDEIYDFVKVDGNPVELKVEGVYIALNKPKSVITSLNDPQGRKTTTDILPYEHYPSLIYVGRLDYDSTGVLLFTTDGELAHALLHPKNDVEKSYVVIAAGKVQDEAAEALRKGIELDDGPTKPAKVEILENVTHEIEDEYGKTKSIFATRVRVTITEGRKRQVRRMLSAVGHHVLELDRVSFAGIGYDNIPRGEYRQLSFEEIAHLKELAGIDD